MITQVQAIAMADTAVPASAKSREMCLIDSHASGRV